MRRKKYISWTFRLRLRIRSNDIETRIGFCNHKTSVMPYVWVRWWKFSFSISTEIFISYSFAIVSIIVVGRWLLCSNLWLWPAVDVVVVVFDSIRHSLVHHSYIGEEISDMCNLFAIYLWNAIGNVWKHLNSTKQHINTHSLFAFSLSFSLTVSTTHNANKSVASTESTIAPENERGREKGRKSLIVNKNTRKINNKSHEMVRDGHTHTESPIRTGGPHKHTLTLVGASSIKLLLALRSYRIITYNDNSLYVCSVHVVCVWVNVYAST